LLSLGISKGQIIALLNQDNAAFHAEKDAVLEAGLATARWVTDTGARHARTNQTTIGDFAWFATRPSKSRLNFLELLRAGRPDYVINAAAEAYMVEHAVPEAVIDALVGHQRFADQAAWAGQP
jgi:methylthioribose-1-phosphate isomerase